MTQKVMHPRNCLMATFEGFNTLENGHFGGAQVLPVLVILALRSVPTPCVIGISVLGVIRKAYRYVTFRQFGLHVCILFERKSEAHPMAREKKSLDLFPYLSI